MNERETLFNRYEDLAKRFQSLRTIIQNNPADVGITEEQLDRWWSNAYEIHREMAALTTTTTHMVIERNEELKNSLLCPHCHMPLTKTDPNSPGVCFNINCITNADMRTVINKDPGEIEIQ